MNYTPKEVMQFVEEEDVKFIRLVFTDVYGELKNLSILSTELSRAFSTGIAIDGSAVRGFGQDVHSDLFLHPDPSTLSIMPWRPEHGSVVRMFCSITYSDGRLFESDTRSILIKAMEDAKEAGYTFNLGTEIEFYLFKLDETGEPTKVPYDNAGYMDIAPLDKGENVRREICLTLEKMGITPECSHHEEGPGQNEIDFRYANPLVTADNVLTFRTVVNAVAQRNGLSVCFSPKPLKNKPGSGLHIHFSVNSNDRSINSEQCLSYAMAGILANIKDMTAFLNPCDESYHRLGSCKAPRYLSWSYENRSQLIRVPATAGGPARAELRSPDSTANPYIAFALIIYAALDGLLNKRELCDETDVNLFSAGREITSKLDTLPDNLKLAVETARNSKFIRTSLPDTIIRNYCDRSIIVDRQ